MVATLMLLDLLSECLRLKQAATALDYDIKFRKFMRAYRAKFDPAQPRDERGRWTSGSSIAGSDGGADEEGANGGEGYGNADDGGGWDGYRSASGVVLAAGVKRSAAYCWNQMQIDMLMCSTVQPASRRAVCRGQANERYGACLAGRQIPPLSY